MPHIAVLLIGLVWLWEASRARKDRDWLLWGVAMVAAQVYLAAWLIS